jgi:23S rRNA pseudouridine2605 synthase
MGLRVDPTNAVIKVDGMRITTQESGLVHLALNKPRGVVSTMSDPEGRPSLGDYVRNRRERLFHVGRLDADTEGLILLTNDGELAHRLTHPSYEVPKTYLAEVVGPIARDLGKRLRNGIELDDGLVTVDEFRVVSRSGARVMLELVLHEGRKHVVRRLLDSVGYPVERLVRTDLGPIKLGDLRVGNTRRLTHDEVGALYRAVGL